MWWLAWIYVAILCVFESYAMKALMLALYIYINVFLCLRRAWRHWIFLAYRLVIVVGGVVSVMLYGGLY